MSGSISTIQLKRHIILMKWIKIMIVTIAEKAFDKIQHVYYVDIHFFYTHFVKSFYKGKNDQPTANIILMWEAESFCSMIRNKTSMPTLAAFIQRSIGNPSHCNQTRKRNKKHPNQTKSSKIVSVCRWLDII